MGTRSLVRVFDAEDKSTQEIVCIYRQFDGYPEGMGIDLAEFLKDIKMVNGIPLLDGKLKVANGPDDLAAQLVVCLKGDSIGNVYIMKAKTKDVSEEYEYHVIASEKTGIHMKAFDVDGSEKRRTLNLLFEGPPKKCLELIKKLSKEEEEE